MAKKLVVFSFAYPYGQGELWKYYELLSLSQTFKEIKIIPFEYGGTKQTKHVLPQNITVLPPLFPERLKKSQILALGIFNFSSIKRIAKEIFQKKVYLNKAWLKTWLFESLTVRFLESTEIINALANESDKETVIYFYWGTGAASLAPFFKKAGAKVVVRFHGVDLYEYRSDGYLAFREDILKSIDCAVFISKNGMTYLEEKYNKISFPKRLSRLGVIRKGGALMSDDGVLRIASCSFLVPLKRVGLIVEALSLVDFPVEWTHIGDGPLFDIIKERTLQLPSHVKVNLKGFVKSDEVLNCYVGNKIDLFLNVSETEGVPVSIMEALSAGIPVMATNVGGTGELVDNSVGKILPDNINPLELCEVLTAFHHTSHSYKTSLRQNALKVFKDKCDAEKLYPEFAAFMVGL